MTPEADFALASLKIMLREADRLGEEYIVVRVADTGASDVIPLRHLRDLVGEVDFHNEECSTQ